MISEEEIRDLLYQMVRIRVIEERIAELYAEREMRCPVHLCIGQEAVPVGVCANLSTNDYVLSTHRSHGHYLAKGGDLRAMVAELYGKMTGCSLGKGGSMHLVDLSVGFLGATSIVGSTIPIAVGAALGSVMAEQQRVTVVFLGDGAAEEGVFHESLNFSVLKKLPVVFVCENNFYSVYSPLSVRQPKNREIIKLSLGHEMESYQGDGNNVLEVQELASQAITKARRGDGPTFLEFKTYRWRTHCGGRYDNDLGYRKQSELEEWQRLCPIKQMKSKLLSKNMLTLGDFDAMLAELKEEVEAAVQFGKESPFPDKKLLFEHILAE